VSGILPDSRSPLEPQLVFLDRGNLRKASVRAAVISGIGAALMIGVTGVAAFELYQLRQDVAQITERRDALQREVAALDEEIARKRAENQRLGPLALQSLGHVAPQQATEAVVTASVNAIDIADRLAATGKERRGALTIQYYARDLDRVVNEDVVLPRLRSYGFHLAPAPASRLADVPTNVVWKGAGVSDDDARLVVAALVAAGVQIKGVRDVRDPEGPKRNIIEIGASVELRDAPPLTVDQIANGDVRR
jgi:hypothetical protein